MEQVTKLNLTLGEVVEKVDTENPKGTVIFQSIPKDSVVEEGTEISFYISSGVTDDENPTGNPEDNDPLVSTGPSPAPQPGEDQPVINSSKVIEVDVSQYSEPVWVRVEVGNVVQYNSPVDPSNGTFHTTITGSGEQRVSIYIDDVLLRSFDANFGD